MTVYVISIAKRRVAIYRQRCALATGTLGVSIQGWQDFDMLLLMAAISGDGDDIGTPMRRLALSISMPGDFKCRLRHLLYFSPRSHDISRLAL